MRSYFDAVLFWRDDVGEDVADPVGVSDKEVPRL